MKPLRIFLILAAIIPLACTSTSSNTAQQPGAPVMRVRIASSADKVTLSCGASPSYQIADSSAAQLNSPRNSVFTLSLSQQGWVAGSAVLGGRVGDTLTLHPSTDGSVSINGIAYRGRFRFVPLSGGKFDVINDVDMEAYLCSVVPAEMPPHWSPEAYRAQAIVARTYAIYEKQTAGAERHWDVHTDTRSQVYGGIPTESAKSRETVADTAGIVVAFPNAAGEPKIFKAYFSACCGGISQSVTDAFGEQWIDPLQAQDAQAACRASPRFNWGPVEIKKDELTKRFQAFGERKGRPEKSMATIKTIEIQAVNQWNRPVRFLVTDIRGNRYTLGGEEFRWAVNTNATEGTILYSSFVKIINDSDRIRFVEGHGWGHGVGMCQWCAQSRALAGMRHEDILAAAFPKSSLVRAY